MAFGTGSAIAHRAVGAAAGAMSGGSEAQYEEPMQAQQQQSQPMQSNNLCADFQQQFFQCLQQSNGDANACQGYFNALSDCQAQAKSF